METAGGWLLAVTLLIITLGVATGSPISLRDVDEDSPEYHEPHFRYRRQIPDERPSCQPGQPAKPTTVATSSRLAALRSEFANVPGGAIHAYYILSGDAHQSEYTSEYDKRRGYVSGFSGSAGTAVVTTTKAALWTDSRYFLEAEDALDCNWILMKQSQPNVPTTSDWLITELKEVKDARIGANPYLMSSGTWTFYSEKFARNNISFVEVTDDLVDNIWTNGRPAQPDSTINELPMKYAGQLWQDKVKILRDYLDGKKGAAYVLTQLEDNAYLFNLRAADISYNPFFLSYTIVEKDRVRLFIKSHLRKLIEDPSDPASTMTLQQHLNTGADGTCSASEGMCVEVLEYDFTSVRNAIKDIAAQNASNMIYVPSTCSQAIYSAAPEDQVVQETSMVQGLRVKKNAVEREGMRAAHVRDAAALITFMEKLEREVKSGAYWTEVSASAELKKHRLAQDLNRGLSFGTIAGSGANGAIVHYSPSSATDKQITTSDMLLLDSGGQYLDGTIDVTRTFHFGFPTDFQKESYTRVLMGHLDVALAKWPKGATGLETIARAPLWNGGLTYGHGTGHGIGSYLSVHESPSLRASLEEHTFISDEPGYYKAGEFGIRLESIVEVEKVKMKNAEPNSVFFGFRATTLVPYEPNLIKYEMLSPQQIRWLHDYTKRVEKEVGPLLSSQALDWVRAREIPLTINTSAAGHISASMTVVMLLCCVLAIH